MKGIVLASHGPLCKGMFETTQWFMGKDIPQYTYCMLDPDDSPDYYDEKLQAAITSVDSGEGVIVITDLMGGTPCNRAMMTLSQGVQLFGGMNLPFVLELLGRRLFDNYEYDSLTQTGKDGVVDVNKVVASNVASDDDE